MWIHVYARFSRAMFCQKSLVESLSHLKPNISLIQIILIVILYKEIIFCKTAIDLWQIA